MKFMRQGKLTLALVSLISPFALAKGNVQANSELLPTLLEPSIHLTDDAYDLVVDFKYLSCAEYAFQGQLEGNTATVTIPEDQRDCRGPRILRDYSVVLASPFEGDAGEVTLANPALTLEDLPPGLTGI